jgi:S1-C subfamily serine protease
MSIPLPLAAMASWRAAYGAQPQVAVPEHAAGAVVKLSIRVIDGARTAATLGAEREGTGIVIDRNGLILTIGYLIIEAGSILALTGDGRVFPASVVGFDHATGFGLVRASPGIAAEPLALGESSALCELNPVNVLTHRAAGGLTPASVVSLRPFAGYWEYLLEQGIFTAPARGEHSGAALIDARGRLVGVGSLWVGDAIEGEAALPGNMFVPIDLLKPLLRELVRAGRRPGPARPWIGLYTQEQDGRIIISQVLPDSPAEKVGLRGGDTVLAVGGEPVTTQRAFYEAIWGSGPAGVQISLRVLQGGMLFKAIVSSIDRLDYFSNWKLR